MGAGFSKNAIPKSGAKLPPDWDELGDLFFEKTQNRKPRPKDRAYANVLRLAEEVKCFCGRESCLLANKYAKKYDELLSRWKSYYESEETCWDIRNRYYDDRNT